MNLTFKQFLKEAKYDDNAQSYKLSNRTVFKADAVLSPHGSDADMIIGRQRKKVKQLADKFDVTWDALYAKQFMQSPAYNDWRRKEPYPVWTYVLVGYDPDGNEIAYYKYEGGTGGGGQSHVYVNRGNKQKLSHVLGNAKIRPAKKLVGESKYYGWKEPQKTDFEKGKPIRANNIKRGMLLTCIDARGNEWHVEVLGFTGNEDKYGEGGVKYNSARELYNAIGVRNLKELEEYDSDQEYGYHHYMVVKELATGREDDQSTYNLYVYRGRWCVGSSADAVSFFEAKYIPKQN